MKRIITVLCVLAVLLTVNAACSAGLRISGLPADIRCGTGEKADFSFMLDNRGGTPAEGISMTLEEVLEGTESEEVLGTLTFVSVNGKRLEEETDWLELEPFAAGTSVEVCASYLLPVRPEGKVSLKVTLFDEDFNMLDEGSIRCTLPETAAEQPLSVRGIPVSLVLIVLAVLNAAVWGAVILRKCLMRKKPPEDERR